MKLPVTRMRRLRRTEALRSLVRETHLRADSLISPLFLVPGEGIRRPIPSMPDCFHLSVDEAVKEAESCAERGIGGFLLFGLPPSKDEGAGGAWASDGIVQTGLRALKRQRSLADQVMIADVCLCEYTSHGHCGIVTCRGEGTDAAYEVENDLSLNLLAKAAVSLAEAGADIVAPSDMMDGRVAAIRAALDAAGQAQTPVMSYAAKFASAFYGPFREAADSAPQFGDRRSYQMDAANVREAMREVVQDVAEGADMILMKPAMPYLDVLHGASARIELPIGAYQVSGEYCMLQAAFERGWLERETRHDGIVALHPARRGRLHRHLLRQSRRRGSGVERRMGQHETGSPWHGVEHPTDRTADYHPQWRAFAVRRNLALFFLWTWTPVALALFTISRNGWHRPVLSLCLILLWLAIALSAVWWAGEFRCPRCRRRYGALGHKKGDFNLTRGLFDKVCSNCKLRKFERLG